MTSHMSNTGCMIFPHHGTLPIDLTAGMNLKGIMLCEKPVSVLTYCIIPFMSYS